MNGCNQADLARQASVFLSEKAGKRKNMGRDSVSHYVRGINLPTPAHLWALAKALGCEPYDLVPSMGMPSVDDRSEEHTSELQSLMRISYAVFCLNKKNKLKHH